ncbi:MAG: carbohydrate-binding domain-containing protein [Bacteroidales bacterium]
MDPTHVRTSPTSTVYGEGSLSLEANWNDGICSKDGLVIDCNRITVDAVDDGIRGKDYLIIRRHRVITAGDGLKCDLEEDANPGHLVMEGGDLTIDAGDDAIHTEGSITFRGGTLSIDAGDDAIHAGTDLVIDWAEIRIHSSYEGLESALGDILIRDGDICIVSSDDGDQRRRRGDNTGGGLPRFKSTESTYTLAIEGGFVAVYAQGDGWIPTGI